MKRQRGRNRSVGGGGQSGGSKPQQNANRAFDSNGPEGVKVRGHAQSVYEKYQQLARDAFSSGDRVLAENHLQHAEHYFRLLRLIQPQRPTSEIVARDVFASGIDIDFEEEGEALDAAEAEAQQSDSQPDQNGQGQSDRSDDRGQDRSRNEGQRYERDRPDRNQNDRNQNDRNQNDRYQNDRGGDRPQNDRYANGDRFQNERNGGDRAYGDRSRTQGERTQGDRFAADRSQADRGQTDRQQAERTGGDRPQGDGQREPRAPREERPRYEGRRDDRGERPARDERTFGRDSRVEVEGSAATSGPGDDVTDIRSEASVTYPSMAPATRADAEPDQVAAAPFLGAEAAETASPILRSYDGGVSEAPAFLQAPTAPSLAADGDAEVAPRRRPRTRRRPAGADAADGPLAPAAPSEEG